MSTVLTHKAFEKYKGKDVVVPWSGGLDSTLIILGLHAAGAKRIRTISFTGKQLPNPSHEAFARKKIIEVLKEKGIKIDTHEVDLPVFSGGHWPSEYRYSQHAMWLQQLPLAIPKCQVVAVGYISTDGFIPWIKKMKKHWRAGEYNFNGSLPDLEFPIKEFHKTQVAAELIRLSEQLGVQRIMDFVTFCHQTYKVGNYILRCGKCDNCKSAESKGTAWLQPLLGVENEKRALADITRRNKQDRDGSFVHIQNGELIDRFLRIVIEEGDGAAEFWRNGPKADLTKFKYALVYLGTEREWPGFFKTPQKNLPRKAVILNTMEYEGRYSINLWNNFHDHPLVEELAKKLWAEKFKSEETTETIEKEKTDV